LSTNGPASSWIISHTAKNPSKPETSNKVYMVTDHTCETEDGGVIITRPSYKHGSFRCVLLHFIQIITVRSPKIDESFKVAPLRSSRIHCESLFFQTDTNFSFALSLSREREVVVIIRNS
jgi:hypothetical protein